jgi:alanine-glyoxylate transaminase / serine-glyoxylate transaminase / serine-pyruvate transaminase
MVPPGLGFNAVSNKALAAARNARMPKAYWDWQEMLKANASGFFPYTSATNLLYRPREAIRLIQEEGLDNALQRHARYGDATRAAVRAWGLEVVCELPSEYSNSLTAVFTPEDHAEVVVFRFRQALLCMSSCSFWSFRKHGGCARHDYGHMSPDWP